MIFKRYPARVGIRQLPAAWGAFYVLALITDNGPSETRVVRRSQARGRMASQPHTNHHARAKADRQTDRQTEQAATPTPIRHLSGRVPHPKIRRGAPVTTRTGPRTREAPLAVRCPPIRHLVVRVRVRVRPLCPPKRPHGPGKHQPGLQCAQT